MTLPPPADDFPPWAPRDFFRFELVHRSRKPGSRARVGRIFTPHGVIETPAFVPVGTNAALKCLDERHARDAGVQLMFCNTYHLLVHPSPDVVSGAGVLSSVPIGASSTRSTCPSRSFSTGQRPGFVNGAESVVSCEPLTGVVGPNSKLPVELTFAPSLEKNFNFNMELRVKNKPQPLVLNVKGQGYAIHDTLHLADATGKFVEISSFAPTRVDFGQVHVNDKIVRQLQISNSGRFNFDVSLSLKMPPGVRMPPVAVTPELATVRKDEKLMCQLAYSPTSEAALPQSLALQVQVTNGRSYTLQLFGKGQRPKVVLSFKKRDFGPCFVVTPKNGMKPVEETMGTNRAWRWTCSSRLSSSRSGRRRSTRASRGRSCFRTWATSPPHDSRAPQPSCARARASGAVSGASGACG
jgi:hypothetical protein